MLLSTWGLCGWKHIPYSRKYWWELSLAVGPQIANAKTLADFNLAVAKTDRQTTKFSFPSNFPAIRYDNFCICKNHYHTFFFKL